MWYAKFVFRRLFSTMEGNENTITALVESLIKNNDVVVFSATYCRFCAKVKDLFNTQNIKFLAFEVDEQKDCQLIKDELYRKTNQKTVPNVFIRGHHIGGCDDTHRAFESGSLFQYLKGDKVDKEFEYDLIVIGGGSGGIAAAKEAASLKKKVALFDFVKPTSHGTVWGVGGTCVNVGCIPKKLMHYASLTREGLEDSSFFGWNVNLPEKSQHDWPILIENVQNHIKKLNFNYVKYFKKNNIKYFNAYAVFKDDHTVQATDKKGNVHTCTAGKFILATGGRPHIPPFSGNNFAITSDDIFSLKTKPGKTLIVGASYIALECAGFLHGLGVDCTVMVRSILLRGFDQQIAEMIGKQMESIGVKFIKGFVPVEIETGNWENVDPSLKYKVKMKNIDGDYETEDYFNVVMLATGRDAATGGLGLEEIGVTLNKKNGKVIVDKNDKTTCNSVYAIGDVQDGRMELTPVAIKAGQHLVRRLFANGVVMDYNLIPTTVFTPLEYGSCGYSEEEAIKIYGSSNIECYHSQFQPLEWVLQNRNGSRCYAKLICAKHLKMRVVGLHILGPNAGEITQGFALGLKLQATKYDFDQLVGIHPTSAEVFTTLDVTRAEQPDATQKDC